MSDPALETRELLRRAITSSIPHEPSQFDEVEPRFVYLPAAHTRALDLDNMLVVGMRGAGKSFWWYALQNETLRRRLLENTRDRSEVIVSAGFGQGMDARWPGADELRQLLDLGFRPRQIWKTVVLRQVAPASMPGSTWADSVRWVEANPSAVLALLRETEARLRAAGQRHLVVFDSLDRTDLDHRANRIQLLRGLLELVLELRPLYAVRAKVFVRPDMLEDPEVGKFPDASKVLVTQVALDWTPLDLYALLFTYLGNGNDPEAAAFFRNVTGQTWPSGPDQSHRLPQDLQRRAEVQERAFVTLAGPYMGANRRRGKTYPWVPNHLSDAKGQVSPRSFLAALRTAAEQPEVLGQQHALHYTSIQEGVRAASAYRVREIREDLEWAHEAMAMLGDLIVPCSEEELLCRWDKGGLTPQVAKEGARGTTHEDLQETLEQLAKIRVLQKLPDNRINIPDVYRVGFGLRRHGGFKPLR